MPAPPLESLPAIVSAVGMAGGHARSGSRSATASPCRRRAGTETAERLRATAACSPAAVGRLDDRSGSTRSSAAGPGPPPPGLKSTTPRRPCGFSDARDVPQQRDDLRRIRRVVHLVIGVDDQHGVECRRGSCGSVGVPEHRSARCCSPSRCTRRLIASIICGWMSSAYTSAVRPDAAREPDREPAAAGAEVGDDRAVGDAERVHDLIGLLPLLAIGRFEQAEILSGGNSRSLRLAAGAGGGRAPARRGDRTRSRRADGARSRTHDRALTRLRRRSRRLRRRRPACRLASPTMPPRVIASTDRISSSCVCVEQPALEHELANRTVRSRTDSFAISAVAA